MDKKIRKKKSFWYYVNPRNIKDEVREYGYPLSVKRTALYYAGFFAVLIAICLLFQLDIPYIAIVCAAGLFALPQIVINMYKQMYEQIRFNDANRYISQMLYSFKATKKILASLKETKQLFEGTGSPMEMQLNKAINTCLTEGREKALSYITEVYDCERIKKIHELMLDVEAQGGNCDKSIELLLNDRKEWSIRTNEFQKDKHKAKVNIIGAIIVTLLLCLSMEYIFAYAFGDNKVVQKLVPSMLSATAIIIADMFVYVFTLKKCAVSWLNDTAVLSDETIKKYYSYLVNYNHAKEMKKAVIFAVVLNVLMLFLFISTKSTLILAADALVTLMTLLNPKKLYKKRYKAIRNEIIKAYPKWLMSLALLLQTDSIRVSLVKSLEKAPFVMRPELNKLVKEIVQNNADNNSKPYLDFMAFFDIPEITSSMQMLYALSKGVAGAPQDQIDNLLEQNNELLNKSIKIAKDDELERFKLISSVPNTTATLKLATDMLLFFFVFMNMVSNSITIK